MDWDVPEKRRMPRRRRREGDAGRPVVGGTDMEEHDRLLVIAEAADRLGLSPLTIYKWISARRIGCVRLGRAVRIPESEIARLIEAGRRPARPVWPRVRRVKKDVP